MAMDEWRDSAAHNGHPHPLDPSCDPRSSAQKRTRIVGAKNLKNHEVALLHQHFLRRNKVQKDTVFVIHGVKQDFNNIRRKIRRLKDSQLKPIEDSVSLPQLPPYIELRSPSPEFTQAQVRQNRECFPKLPQEKPTSTGPQNSHIINTESDTQTTKNDEDEIMTDGNAGLSNSPRSELTDTFRASRPESRGSGAPLTPDRIQTLSPSRKESLVGAKPISMEIEDPIGDQDSRPRRESIAGSLMDGMSWGGISVGSFIRDEVLMGTSPSVTFGPSSSLQSTSYLPKLEQNFMRDFRCCDQTLPTLHDLLEHYEENHLNNPSNPLSASTNKQGLFPIQGGSRQPNR